MKDIGWKDNLGNITAGKAVGANAPTWSTFRDGLEGYEFHQSTMNEVWITFHINHDVMLREPMYPHVHWSPDTTSTGVVRWGMEFSIANRSADGVVGSAFGSSTTIYVEENITSDSQYEHIVSEVSDADALQEDWLDIDALVLMRVFRDASHANDTFPDGVFGWFVDIHYKADKVHTPNKAPNFYRSQ